MKEVDSVGLSFRGLSVLTGSCLHCLVRDIFQNYIAVWFPMLHFEVICT
jgi:hypothetical protein